MKILDFARKHGVRQEGKEILLKSGASTKIYYNWRAGLNTLESVQEICEILFEYIQEKNLEVHQVLGIPDGGTKIGLFLQKRLWEDSSEKNLMTLLRKNVKVHGSEKDDIVVGCLSDKGVWLLEDVITTGGSAQQVIESLEKYTTIQGLICLTDRGSPQTFRDFLQARDIQYHPLLEKF